LALFYYRGQPTKTSGQVGGRNWGAGKSFVCSLSMGKRLRPSHLGIAFLAGYGPRQKKNEKKKREKGLWFKKALGGNQDVGPCPVEEKRRDL